MIVNDYQFEEIKMIFVVLPGEKHEDVRNRSLLLQVLIGFIYKKLD